MEAVRDVESLEKLYGNPKPPSLVKVADRIVPAYRPWIERSRFCVLTTVGPEGTDASPRGDDGPVVTELDPRRLALPDWRGNDRIDSLRNVVRDGRLSLMFFVPGSNTVIRINGHGVVTVDPPLRDTLARNGKLPRSVIVVTIREVYFQCARALLRAGLWSGADESVGLPTAGDILADMSAGAEGGLEYDKAWAARAAQTMW